ncbi:MAG: T9SS type A sorting domain-containing protein [Bacteroidota bacterium]
MKKLILSISVSLMATLALAQETTVNLSLGAGYENEVYYKLSDETSSMYLAADWDLAFLRTSIFDLGVRVNDGIGIKVYEVADTPAGYETVDVTNQGSWVELYNSDTEWKDGAFMQGSASFGFGEYNPATNHVEGTIIFVLEYQDGTFRKLFIEDYFGAYTFKYATWDGANWSADITTTVSNTSNPDAIFNYYSLETDSEVIGEPNATDWDFVFRKYNTYLDPPGQYYNVTGALHNPNVTVAQNEETGAPNPNGLSYLEAINTIGYDWKEFTGTWVIDSDQKYYVKYEDNTVFRLYFTEFEGSSTGNLTFVFEDVSGLLGLETLSNGITFGMSPNPSVNKTVDIIYDLTESNSDLNQVDIYDLNGRKVFAVALSNTQGFYSNTLDLSALQSGVYVVRFSSGNKSISKKLILN